jgi:hypothetical protein
LVDSNIFEVFELNVSAPLAPRKPLEVEAAKKVVARQPSDTRRG